MANPQKEFGYTAVANEILEVICKLKLNGTQYRLVLALWRATYGFNKLEHELSLSYLASYLNTHVNVVGRELKALQEMNIIKVVRQTRGNHSRHLMFNKDYETWMTTNQSVDPTNQLTQPISCIGINQSVDKGPTNQLTKKERIKKNKEKHICDFFDDLWDKYPRKLGKKSVSQKSMVEMDKLGFAAMSKAIENYKREIESNKTDEKYIKHGSTFFNGGYIDYLENDNNSDIKKEGDGELWQ